MNVISNCCKQLNDTPETPVVAGCSGCFAISSPYISYDRTVGPCNEEFSVVFSHSTNCQSVEYAVKKSDPAFYDLHFVGNVLYGKTHPNYIADDITKTYNILVVGTCKSGASVGFSAQGKVQIPILVRCLNKATPCDRCTGVVGPTPTEVVMNRSNNEIGV